jgi:hypothetical protein
MRRAPELVWAVVAITAATLLYLPFSGGSQGDAGALVGHTLGIVGFLLMLATETLYAIRKRSTGRAWGPMRTWLRVHIFTGIVGPYLVLLHGTWRFAGLAGAATVAMLVVVGSGFVGRYLYNLLPRGPAGEDTGETIGAAARARRWLAVWHTVHVPLGLAMFTLAFVHVGAAIWYAVGAR